MIMVSTADFGRHNKKNKLRPRVLCLAFFSHLEAPSIYLPIEALEFPMVELFPTNHTDQQFFVQYLPRAPVGHPRNDVSVLGPRQNVMQLLWKGFDS